MQIPLKLANYNVTFKSKMSGHVGERPCDEMIKAECLGQVGVGGAKREAHRNCRKFTCLTNLLTASYALLVFAQCLTI